MMKVLLLVLLFAATVRADADICMPYSRGVVPSTRLQARQCDHAAGRIFRQLRRLCTRYPGINICIRFLGPNPWLVSERNACNFPSPTLEECCAAGETLLMPGLTCPGA